MRPHRIYLDWNATAPLAPVAKAAFIDALERFGNASSVHIEGQAARATVETVRRQLAACLSMHDATVVFTSGATEANNLAIHDHIASEPNARLICSAVEHPSVLEVVRHHRPNAEVWPVDGRARVRLDWLSDRLDEGGAETALVSLMFANNETGNVYPIAKVAELCRERGARLHVDATQAIGRIELGETLAAADYVSLSFHKCGGPKGVGALIVADSISLEPLLFGGHQERGKRPGTENVPAIASVGALLDELSTGQPERADRLATLRARFVARLEGGGGTLRGSPGLPNTVNIAFDQVDGEDLLLALDLEGVAASSGSACTAGSLEPSHVILAMGFDEDEARRSVRFSFGEATTAEELDEAAEIVLRTIGRVRVPHR